MQATQKVSFTLKSSNSQLHCHWLTTHDSVSVMVSFVYLSWRSMLFEPLVASSELLKW